MTINIRKHESSHYYFRDGTPCYEVPKKTGSGMRKTTIADARALQLLPSVTTILRIIHKPALQDWLVGQAVRAVMDTPRLPGESKNDFVERVLVQDRIQDMESSAAAGLGTAIHDALEDALTGGVVDESMLPYVKPVLPIMESLGKLMWSEKVLVGKGYAGKCDAAAETDEHIVVVDFKSVGKAALPLASYDDHKMQLAAYAKPIANTSNKHILTANIYISTVSPGLVNLCLNDHWEEDYDAFINARNLWAYMNKYKS